MSNCIERLIEKLHDEIRDRERRIGFLQSMADKFEGVELATEPSFSCGSLDFDFLPHKDIVKVVRAIGGKWNKRPAAAAAHDSSKSGRVDYLRTIGEFEVRCWAGDPPPNCKVVEEVVVIPQQIIPEQRKVVKKLVCKPAIEEIPDPSQNTGLRKLVLEDTP